MEVWYAFTAKSKNEPVLKVHADKVYDELRHAMATVITYLMELNLSRTDLDKELEIERLYALVDGLGIHAILRPDQMNTKIMENILTTHLATLCRDAE
ncbi:TetR family transcriptional regulator C-terminal domain-containing protein [Paenibacillus taichungensis]